MDADQQLARKNNRIAAALLGIALLLFAGTFVIALVYLHFK
jgi:hypothetical protein